MVQSHAIILIQRHKLLPSHILYLYALFFTLKARFPTASVYLLFCSILHVQNGFTIAALVPLQEETPKLLSIFLL